VKPGAPAGRQSLDNASGDSAPGDHAEKKSLIAREQDEQARSISRQVMDHIDPQTLVFLDETSTPTTMTPLRARAPRGTRILGWVPRGRWASVTLLATLTPSGFGPGLQIEGALDRQSFDTFVARTLLPTLRPGTTVVLDNLSVHKSATARTLIETAGCHLVFLPTYSPDFNPIEPALSKLKQLLRRAEARSLDAVMTATSDVYSRITAADAHAYYRAAGYFL